MPDVFHIAFPFEVAVSLYRPGEHAPLCTHPIPLSFTETYRSEAVPGFAFTRQWYANKLMTIDLIEGTSPEPFTAVLGQSKSPAYVLAVLLEGLFRYDHPDGSASESPLPGTVYFARLNGLEYPIHFLSETSRMLVIAVHAAQLDVIGEDFAELAELLDADEQPDDIIGPPIQADNLLKRRLIKLISPAGIERRKDFNKYLVDLLLGVCSAIKGILRGKGQVRYDKGLLAEIVFSIASTISDTHQAPLPQQLADSFYVTPKKLERLFKDELALSPSTYIHRQHLEAAGIYIVEHRDMPIYEIADLFGYRSTAAFSKAFRRHHGLSPEAYREAAT